MKVESEELIAEIDTEIKSELAQYTIVTPYARGLAYARFLVKAAVARAEKSSKGESI